MNLTIIPTPKFVKPLDGDFQINNNIVLEIRTSVAENIFSVELIQNAFKDFHNIHAATKGKGNIIISLIGNDEQGSEIKNLGADGYILRITSGKIELKANTPKGIYYAAVSLIQLLEKADGKLECMEIFDWPDMKFRGISDDISRGQVSTLENFKKIISHIARYKMNTYMPYIEDMLEFEKYPTIGKDRGALTKAEVKEIIEFAKQNFVEVIPIFQTLGHYENILSQDEFLKYAEFIGAASLNVSSDSTYIFLEELLKEVFELFPSEYFHMGADESYDVGLGESKKLVEQTNIAVVHANHYKKVYDICRKYNKKVMMYGDILLDHPEILALIPKDIMIVDWHYRADENYSSTKTIRDAGFEYLVSPSAWNFTSTFPVNINSLPNIKYIVKSGRENESSGMINSNWGDYGAETFKEFILYNYAWSAQCSWDYNQSDLSKFNSDYFYDYFGINDERLLNIYKTLSDPLNQIVWNEVWRHPSLNFRESPWWEPKLSKAVRISWNEMTLPLLKKDIELLKSNVKKNADHLELFGFMIKLNEWYKLKLETQYELQKFIKENEETSADDLSAQIEKNIEMLTSLKNDYRKHWLKYYKEANLSMIEDKFDRLILYFYEIKSVLAKKHRKLNPLIESKWLYLKSSDSTYESKAEFMATFELDEMPSEVLLQLLGDTYVQLYINGKFVERVYARRSLSLLVDYKRIKFLDIKSLLMKGKNTITLISESFNKKSGAGFNLIASLKLEKSELIISSDDSKESSIKWVGREINGNNWREAVSKPYSFDVIAPNFKTKRTSWIER